jgi:hypothetical protein
MKKLILALVLSLVGPLSAAHHAAAGKEADDKSKSDKEVAQCLESMVTQVEHIQDTLKDLHRAVASVVLSPKVDSSLPGQAKSIAQAYTEFYCDFGFSYDKVCKRYFQQLNQLQQTPAVHTLKLPKIDDYPEWKLTQVALRQAAEYIAKTCLPTLQDKIWQHFVVTLPQTDLIAHNDRVYKEAHDVLNETMLVHQTDVARDSDVLDPLPVPVRRLVAAYVGIMKFALKDVAHILPLGTSRVCSITHINDLRGLEWVQMGHVNTLDLDHLNEINSVPSSFPYSYPSMKSLRMQKSGLQHFPFTLFKTFPGLYRCDLSHNHICSLSEEELLYLRQMQYATINLLGNPLNAETIKKLQEINASGRTVRIDGLPGKEELPATAAAGTAPTNGNTDQKS